MNRRELLKMLGLAATVPIISLPLSHTLLSDPMRPRLLSTPQRRVTGVVVDLYAAGNAKLSKVGYVALLRNEVELVRFSMNSFGSYLRWIPPIDGQPIFAGDAVGLKVSPDIEAHAVLMTVKGPTLITTAVTWEET